MTIAVNIKILLNFYILEVEADLIQNHKDFIDSLLKGARYFIVKSNNHENVTLSKAKVR